MLIRLKAYLRTNYSYLLELWDKAYEETKETETRACINGVAEQMTLLSFISELHWLIYCYLTQTI